MANKEIWNSCGGGTFQKEEVILRREKGSGKGSRQKGLILEAFAW